MAALAPIQPPSAGFAARHLWFAACLAGPDAAAALVEILAIPGRKAPDGTPPASVAARDDGPTIEDVRYRHAILRAEGTTPPMDGRADLIFLDGGISYEGRIENFDRDWVVWTATGDAASER